MATIRVGSKGTVVIPRDVREQLGIAEGSLLLIDLKDGEVRLRPAMAVPVEIYTRERQAHFILNDAIDDASYKKARKIVKAMGVDPDSIAHDRPTKR